VRGSGGEPTRRRRVALGAALLALVAVGAARADPFADAVVSVTIGEGGGAGAAADVLGAPRGAGAFQGSSDTLSLGLGGSIVVAFEDNVVVDGPGPDLTVFENAFLLRGLVTYPPYAEPATVSVSADGVHWATFPCAAAEAPWYPGCAGVYPVFANADDPLAPSPLEPSSASIASLVDVPVDAFVAPGGSGGDSFDLAQVGLAAIRFLRIDGGMRDRRLGGLSGFDLDAVAALHSIDTPAAADADGDGAADAVDPCPADPGCGPFVSGGFRGSGRGGPAEDLLTWVVPVQHRLVLEPGARRARLVVNVAPGVAAGSVEVRVGRADHTAALGPFVPGSTRVLEVPVDRRRTAVTVRARAADGRSGRRDLDRIVVVTTP